MRLVAFRCTSDKPRPWLGLVVAGRVLGFAAGRLHWRRGGFWIAVYLLGVAFAVQVWRGRWHSLSAGGATMEDYPDLEQFPGWSVFAAEQFL